MKEKMLRPFRFIADAFRYARDMHRIVSVSRKNMLRIEDSDGIEYLKEMKDDHYYHLILIFKKIDDQIRIKGSRFVQVNSPKHRQIGRKKI